MYKTAGKLLVVDLYFSVRLKSLNTKTLAVGLNAYSNVNTACNREYVH